MDVSVILAGIVEEATTHPTEPRTDDHILIASPADSPVPQDATFHLGTVLVDRLTSPGVATAYCDEHGRTS